MHLAWFGCACMAPWDCLVSAFKCGKWLCWTSGSQPGHFVLRGHWQCPHTILVVTGDVVEVSWHPVGTAQGCCLLYNGSQSKDLSSLKCQCCGGWETLCCLECSRSDLGIFLKEQHDSHSPLRLAWLTRNSSLIWLEFVCGSSLFMS